jgi:hypothetical protein
MAFLNEIAHFESRNPAYLTAPVLIAISTGGSRARFFVGNLGCFAQVMGPEGLKEAFCRALGADGGAANYFIRHIADFRGLPYLGSATLKRAMSIAAKKVGG